MKVAIGYKQLSNEQIKDIPIPKLQVLFYQRRLTTQKNGFLFIWVINARYAFALEMFEKWGYTFVM
jgi:mRNA (2'-O-methyladenosine-N6-)-methyltransferase